MFVWRRNYRSLVRRWRDNLTTRNKKHTRNFFSWKDRIRNDHQQPYFYITRQQTSNKK